MNIRVECYSGYRGEESPRRFHMGERCVEIVEELDRWFAPDYRYFKVRSDDGSIYILRHDASTSTWELTVFESNLQPPARGHRS